MTSFVLILAIFMQKRRHFFKRMQLMSPENSFKEEDVTKCCNAGTAMPCHR